MENNQGYWTADKVREELPFVAVRINGRNVIGRVLGRLLPFAGVIVGDVKFDVAWETVANCLNSGRPIQY